MPYVFRFEVVVCRQLCNETERRCRGVGNFCEAADSERVDGSGTGSCGVYPPQHAAAHQRDQLSLLRMRSVYGEQSRQRSQNSL